MKKRLAVDQENRGPSHENGEQAVTSGSLKRLIQAGKKLWSAAKDVNLDRVLRV
jgi:hypothetical protein